jgi:hypothetical protein
MSKPKSAASGAIHLVDPAAPPDLPPDHLAKAFIDLLRKDAGVTVRPRGGELDPALAALLSDLPQDEDVGPRLRPERAAAAVLLARAFEDGQMGLIRELKSGAPVIAVAVGNPDLVPLARLAFQVCVLGSSRRLLEGGNIKGASDSRSVLGVVREEADPKKKITEELAYAFERNLPVIGIAPDPKRHLPRELMRVVTHHLTLPGLDASAIHRVIEAVVGEAPVRLIKADLVTLVDLADFALARLEALVAKKMEVDEDGPSLTDLSGYGEARDWGLALADDLAGYRAGTVRWDEIDGRGLLLSGPPGTGKTSFARALAKSCRVPLVATSVAQWNAGDHLGTTLQAIQDVFRRARRMAPSILFIDELDGISDRAKLDNRHVEYWSQIVNLFLEELQGIEQREGVVVVGASNHPDRIDPAVRRSGRLDREIRIELPKPEDLALILRFHLGEDALAGVDLMPAAIRMMGKSGADAEAYVRRAKAAARRAKRPLALDDLVIEIKGKSEDLSPADRRIVAVHEAGHAVAALLTGRKVDWLGYTESGGITQYAPTVGLFGLAEIEAGIVATLGGMAAEEIIFGRVTVGCGGSANSDIVLATEAARQIETMHGLGRFGPVDLDGVTGGVLSREALSRSPLLMKPVSDRIMACQERARALVRQHRRLVELVAAAMAKEGFVSGETFEALARACGVEPPVGDAIERPAGERSAAAASSSEG